MIIDPKKKQAEKLSSQNKSAKGKENKSPITEELKAGSNSETLSNDSNRMVCWYSFGQLIGCSM